MAELGADAIDADTLHCRKRRKPGAGANITVDVTLAEQSARNPRFVATAQKPPSTDKEGTHQATRSEVSLLDVSALQPREMNRRRAHLLGRSSGARVATKSGALAKGIRHWICRRTEERRAGAGESSKIVRVKEHKHHNKKLGGQLEESERRLPRTRNPMSRCASVGRVLSCHRVRPTQHQQRRDLAERGFENRRKYLPVT